MLATLLSQDNITHRITPVAGLAALVDLKDDLVKKDQVCLFFSHKLIQAD